MKKRNLQRKRQQRNIWAINSHWAEAPEWDNLQRNTWAMNNKPELEVLEDKDIPLNVIVINKGVKK